MYPHLATPMISGTSDLLSQPAHCLIFSEDMGLPDEKIRDHLQIAIIAVIVLFSMAVFFYEALRLTIHIQNFNFQPIVASMPDSMVESRSISFSLPS